MNTWTSPSSALDSELMLAIMNGQTSQPQEFLGPLKQETETKRPENKGSDRLVLVRTFLPTAEQVTIINRNETKSQPMTLVHPYGLWEVNVNADDFETSTGSYKFQYTQGDDTIVDHDPYAFPPLLSDMDLHLFNEGNHYEIYKKLGAHVREIDGITGINFAVWAPNAQAISVVGNFNDWDGRRNPLQK